MQPNNIQLVEPNLSAANQIIAVLEGKGYSVNHFTSGRAALYQSRSTITLVSSHITDISLTDFIRQFHQKAVATNRSSTPISIAIVDQAQGMMAADAMKAGATDYLLRPFESEQLLGLLARVEALDKPLTNIVVESWRSKQVLQLAHRAAGTNATVLITGESGTGKEVLAQYVHQHSSRSNAPFVAVNCAAIPESMLEAVLFGHVKGAFTGATQTQTGKFEEANGGTILLDEIAEMSPSLQAKLLRVLQEREVEKVGSHKTVPLDIRVIASTNKDLRVEIQKGTFREDLYYRLDVLPLHWPSLRDRSADILPLARFFINKYQMGSACQLSEDACFALSKYHWPGNIRELENVMQRALVMRHGDFITAQDLMLPIDPNAAPSLPQTEGGNGRVEAKKMAEFQYIIKILKQFGGNRTKTAQQLGVTTRALRYKLAAMREQGIDIDAVLGSAA
ncbi:sigma-54-dependent Fis family transcriptional regulator [Photobacterium angustum]|uniref:Sigma-54-dependent Fis family transcriptional regulator n=1 Tax=Photobacterium angustum TaxID=661 RepID=A0A855SEU5_PHOAN|nr:sigma-54 dependent transcriptional regulator [Photobacterium angustum]KJF83498.1 ATPase AAA [Photobacterium damselae subsp. damselae]KJG02320.1 ATPase AAA [Photobacterium angustum]KJG04602.1 ATPase AAA [Photobacterium angustum]KJG17394.1 ATPase AAA [Photobacterium angustum]KJG23862.1 ATPase AAA [Photobacterium angustum]